MLPEVFEINIRYSKEDYNRHSLKRKAGPSVTLPSVEHLIGIYFTNSISPGRQVLSNHGWSGP